MSMVIPGSQTQEYVRLFKLNGSLTLKIFKCLLLSGSDGSKIGPPYSILEPTSLPLGNVKWSLPLAKAITIFVFGLFTDTRFITEIY